MLKLDWGDAQVWMDLAATLYFDRQIRRSQRWTVLIPIWVALTGGVVVVVKALVNSAPDG